MLDAFTMLTEDLDHPEACAWDPLSGRVYAGGEDGQVYSVSLDGAVAQVADTGGGILGVAVDGNGLVYACDEGRCEVVSVDPATGRVNVVSSGTGDRPMIEPNYLCFAADGTLFVTDSSDWEERNGAIYRIAEGETTVWTTALPCYPNGCCLSGDGAWLYVVESSRPGISRVPIGPRGEAGDPETVIDLPRDTVPDGIAFDAAGSLYIACYRPDSILRLSPGGVLDVVARDPLGMTLNTPTNVAFAGPDLGLLVVANVGEWHLLIGDIGVRGAPLQYPLLG
jgi:gluconolactonase